MRNSKTVDEYILEQGKWTEMLCILREILLEADLKETIKWGGPVYVYKDENVVGLGAFKNYVAIWFFQGALLADKKKVLINATENVTKALRQWRFESEELIDSKLIAEYLQETIKNIDNGKKIPRETDQPLIIPIELENELKNDENLNRLFNNLKLTEKREICGYISSAKQEKTRISRMEKCIEIILSNKSLYDKYKKK